MQDVTIPALGMAMTGAVLTRWYKEPGEAVAVGEVIAEIETDESADAVLARTSYAVSALADGGPACGRSARADRRLS